MRLAAADLFTAAAERRHPRRIEQAATILQCRRSPAIRAQLLAKA